MQYGEFLHGANAKSIDCKELQDVFNYVTEKESVYAMTKQIEINKPPLIAVASEIEKLCNGKTKNKFFKSALGRLISYVLGFYGYEIVPKASKNIPRSCGSNFSVGATYRFNKDKQQLGIKSELKIVPLSE